MTESTLPNPNVGLKTGRPPIPPAGIGMSVEIKSGGYPAMVLAAVLFVSGALFWAFAILAGHS